MIPFFISKSPSWLMQFLRGRAPLALRLLALKFLEKKRMTFSEFRGIEKKYQTDVHGRSRFLQKNFLCPPIIDSNFLNIIKKLRLDFGLKNFVETGTFRGDTSLFFSLLFDTVLTCDAVDHKRRPEFYFRDNLIYETSKSLPFLSKHRDLIREDSLFFLDSHWGKEWPLRKELAFIFGNCLNPVIVLDDFDTGGSLDFDRYQGKNLDFRYIADLIPQRYKFVINPWSNRRKGILFLFPAAIASGTIPYGRLFSERDSYSEKTDGLWESFETDHGKQQ